MALAKVAGENVSRQRGHDGQGVGPGRCRPEQPDAAFVFNLSLLESMQRHS
jgi:hypothetical protein